MDQTDHVQVYRIVETDCDSTVGFEVRKTTIRLRRDILFLDFSSPILVETSQSALSAHLDQFRDMPSCRMRPDQTLWHRADTTRNTTAVSHSHPAMMGKKCPNVSSEQITPIPRLINLLVTAHSIDLDPDNREVPLPRKGRAGEVRNEKSLETYISN